MPDRWGTALVRLELLDSAGPPAHSRFLLRVQLALSEGRRQVVGPRVVDLDEARAAVAAALDVLCTSVDRDVRDGPRRE